LDAARAKKVPAFRHDTGNRVQKTASGATGSATLGHDVLDPSRPAWHAPSAGKGHICTASVSEPERRLPAIAVKIVLESGSLTLAVQISIT
jgi:hypothetical protein